MELDHCESVGWIVEETPALIKLVSARGQDGEVGDVQVIPRPWVISLREIDTD